MAARTRSKRGLHGLVRELSHSFGLHADATVALGQKAYMRHQFEFYGLQAPLRRKLQKEVFAKYALEDEAELSLVLKQLWKMEKREYQIAAIDLAVRHKKLWAKGTLLFAAPKQSAVAPVTEPAGETPDTFETFEYMVRNKAWWDVRQSVSVDMFVMISAEEVLLYLCYIQTVDLIASNLVGGLILKFPKLVKRMDEWIDDDFMWARRTAILHQLSYKDKTDEAKLFEFCKQRAHEEEFFIRKAIGWALRQYARTDPEAVRKFVEDNRSMLSPLSVKEACKHL